LLAFDKAAIIQRGVELSAPLHLTWSCYQNEEEACGRCHSCMLRRRGFRSAGVEDPASYAGQAEEPPGPEE
jgi:7-cyano-7-deazaguanine synthase